MGNEICSFDRHGSSINYNGNSEFCIEYKTEEIGQYKGSQNILEDNLQIDQCSPSSRFNIQFLKSSIIASDRKHLNIVLNLQDPIQTSLVLVLKRDRIAKTRKSLIQWSKSKIQNLQKECSLNYDEPKTPTKLQAIKEYEEFIANNIEEEQQQQQESSKYIQLKITGNTFYKIREQSVTPYYSIDQKIGQGSFGSVYKGKCLKTNQQRAIKILKKKIMDKNDQKLLMDEIKILRKMDHINIIKLYDVFYYKKFFYVVTQYCKGGSLLKALQNNQINSQRDVAFIMKQIISAVSYMHQMKIAHRDLKLDNVVLVKKIGQVQQKARIKIIDFGLAQHFQYQYRNKTRIIGTLDYMAPQIFDGFYSYHSDIWSCGIIMHLLLTGCNPFKKRHYEQTVKAIKQKEIDLKKSIWVKISEKAKKLLSQMLNKKPQKRITSQQILQNQWIKQPIDFPEEQIKTNLVIQNFNNFNRGNNFICFIKNFLTSRELSQDVRQEMALIFQKIDLDSSGVIQKQQLIQLYSLVTGVSDLQIQNIINKIDQNQSGRIDFQQFLICMTQNSIMHNQKSINKAFDYLDENQTGFIEKSQLTDCLEGCGQKQLVKILKQIDFNGDGKISREQFTQYLMKVPL